MYTTKDIKSITVQSVYLIIIRMNDNKSYIIDAQELVDIINKELYLKKCRKSRVSDRVDDDLKAKLDDYESEIRDRMSKSKRKSESNSELRNKFSAGELDTIDKIVDEIEKFKEIIGGKCDQGSDLGAAEAAHLPLSQAPAQAPQVVSLPLSPLESKVSDFISNSFSSNSPNSPNPTDNSIDNPIVINIIDSVISTPNSTPNSTSTSNPSNTPTISDCINTINTDVTLLTLATIVPIDIIVKLILAFVTLVAIVIILVSPILLISKQSTVVLIVIEVLIVLIGLRDSLRQSSLSLKLLVTTDKFNS